MVPHCCFVLFCFCHSIYLLSFGDFEEIINWQSKEEKKKFFTLGNIVKTPNVRLTYNAFSVLICTAWISWHLLICNKKPSE